MRRLVVFGTVASAVLVSGCAQLGIGASGPDEATQAMMEACGIEVIEDNGQGESQDDDQGDGANGYERTRFGGGDDPWNAIESDLDDMLNSEGWWRDAAIASRTAARLDSQWDELADYFAENDSFVSKIVSYRRSDDTPSYDELGMSDFNERVATFNENLDRIDVECGALMRTLT